MLIAPVGLGVVGCQATIVLHAHVDQIGDAFQAGVTVFHRGRCFAVAEICQKSKAGHGHLVIAISEGAIGLLVSLDPVQTLDHSFLTLGVASVFLDALQAVIQGATATKCWWERPERHFAVTPAVDITRAFITRAVTRAFAGAAKTIG